MTGFDLTKLPTGELGRTALVEYVVATDDRAERYFLEVKSAVDLNTKADQAKVAKFVLGAANRDAGQASRRFGGYALMVLGVGAGEVVGVPPFEAKDLAKTVNRLVGPDGPAWDFDRVEVDGKDVIVVTVDPPTGDLWTCRADGAGVTDGAIYVRGDGETRLATGDEVRALLVRATARTPGVEVEVSISGYVLAVQVDEDEILSWIEGEAERMRGQIRTHGPAGIAFQVLHTQDRRSHEQFLDEVSAWEESASADPLRGVLALAGRFADGISVRLTNAGRTYLRRVRMDLTIASEVTAVEWASPDKHAAISLFPDRPKDFGDSTIADLLVGPRHETVANLAPRDSHGVVVIRRAGPLALAMPMDALRPEETHESDPDEVVLVMFAGTPPEHVTATWRVTAEDVHDVFEGTVDLPVRLIDWRSAIRRSLFGPDDPEDVDA